MILDHNKVELEQNLALFYKDNCMKQTSERGFHYVIIYLFLYQYGDDANWKTVGQS